MNESDGEQARDFFWSELAAQVLHPVRVEIVEAMRWIGRPLSAVDLMRVFEGQRKKSRLQWHLGRLTKLGVVELATAGEVRRMSPLRTMRWPQA
ncbi:MAG: hypothetical protein WD404_09405 [Solirubrobacterales bacterium]